MFFLAQRWDEKSIKDTKATVSREKEGLPP